MKPKIWEKCINCKVNCCKKKEISYTLFLTDKEKKKLKGINKNFPCKFLDRGGLCKVHDRRPIDCRLFPFDIIKKNIREAKEKFSNDNLEYILADATVFNFKKKFNAIILSNVLEHINDRVKFLLKIKVFPAQ